MKYKIYKLSNKIKIVNNKKIKIKIKLSMYSSKYIKKALKTTKCPQSHLMCGHVENVEAMKVEVEAKVVEAMHQMTNHSASTRSMCTYSSSSAPWTTTASSTAPFRSRTAFVAPYTSCRPPRDAFVLICSVHAPDHKCLPHPY